MKLSEFCNQFGVSPNIKEIGIDEYLVYFLVSGYDIVYVGKSSEGGLFGRLKAHQVDKDFDAYFVINNIESDQTALELEKGFISLLRPKYNKAEARVNIKAIQRVIHYVTSLPNTEQPGTKRSARSERLIPADKEAIVEVAWRNPVTMGGFYEIIRTRPENHKSSALYLEKLKKTARNSATAANNPKGTDGTRAANRKRLAFVQAELGRMSVGIVPGDAGPGSIKFSWLSEAEMRLWAEKIGRGQIT